MSTPGSAATQLIALAAGALLVTSVLLVWRRDLSAQVRLLTLQGVSLAVLAVTIGLSGPGSARTELLLVAVLVLVLRAWLLPWVLGRRLRAGIEAGDAAREDGARLNPTASLVVVALLTTLAYLVSRPISEGVATGGVGISGPAAFAVPVGVTMVLIGFLLLVGRRRAMSQLIGFLVLDNGIATVAFLTAAGVPFAVELGVSSDVLLVVLILAVLSRRIHAQVGSTTLDSMTELKD
jgi:hydrogenase-4 component E